MAVARLALEVQIATVTLDLLTCSAGLDAALAPIFNLNSEWFVLFEDGAKWLGIVC